MKTLPDKAFDLAICDPPYGGANDTTINGGGAVRTEVRPIQVNHAFGGRFDRYNVLGQAARGPANTGGIIAWDIAPNEDFFKELFRVSKNQIIWGANYFPYMPPTRCFVVWRKLTISEAFSMAMAEYAWTSFNGNAKVYEAMPQDKYGDRFHPTAKPVGLYTWLLRQFAKEGDTIFDPMMGSGSSRIAAYNMGFDYTGCEINEIYFNKSCELFEKRCHGKTQLPSGETLVQHSLF